MSSAASTTGSLAESATDPPSVSAARLLQIIEHEFAEGLKEARDVAACGPGRDVSSLRRAYLDVLKLCLCDLGGSGTTSVARTQDGHVMSRELSGEQLRLRAAGMDWPLHGLTMVGLGRLDDLQACIEAVVADGVSGDLIEAGSWRGGASLFMRAVLDTLEGQERRVFVADSFQGFPRPEGVAGDGYSLSDDLAGLDFLAVPLEEVKAAFDRFGCGEGVEFVAGFFHDTLPALADRTWSIIRLDGDSYDATRVALDSLYAGLSRGGYVIVDDFFSLDQCRQAVEDFRREHGVSEPVEHVDWNGARWRKETDAASGARSETGRARQAPAARPAPERKQPTRIPAIEEVELREECERLRSRLAAAEAEIERLSSSPLPGPAAWLRKRIGATRSGAT